MLVTDIEHQVLCFTVTQQIASVHKIQQNLQCRDRQTSVMMVKTTLSDVTKGPCLFLKAQFLTYAAFSHL